jgi:hypothetical protein
VDDNIKQINGATAANSQSASTINAGDRHRSPWARRTNWTVLITAIVLLGISVGGYWYHRRQIADIAAEHLRLVVTGPSVLYSGAAAEYLVRTTSVTGKGVPAQIGFTLYASEEKVLWVHKEKAPENGTMRVSVPVEHIATENSLESVRLEVTAIYRDQLAQARARLAVEPAEYVAQLVADRKSYQPGDTIYYRTLTLSRFSLAADRRTTIQFEIFGPDGKPLPNAARRSTTERGICGGEFVIPEKQSPGQYVLTAGGIDGSFPSQRLEFQIAETRTAPAKKPEEPAAPSKVDVLFYPEGGALAANVDNRVYFAARDQSGAAVDIKGSVRDDSGTDRAIVEETHNGMGRFHFAPLSGRQYYLKITHPSGIKEEIALPKASIERRIAITTGSGAFKASEPVELNIRSAPDAAAMPLVVTAACRGVQVGEQITTTNSKEGIASISIPLDENIGGVIRLTAYDYSHNPPKEVAERLVFRQTRGALKVDVKSRREKQDGGDEKINLTISTANEKNATMPAAISVSVVDESLLGSSDKREPTMPEFFLFDGEIDRPERLAGSVNYLYAESADAAAALDMLLCTQGRRTGNDGEAASQETPKSGDGQPEKTTASSDSHAPMLFDNLKEIRDNYDQSLLKYRQRQTQLLYALTTVCFFGGLGLLLLVVMLGLLRIVWGMRFWLPAVAVSFCCLVLGETLTESRRLSAPHEDAVAFVPYSGPSVTQRKSDVKSAAAGKSGEEPARQTEDEKTSHSSIYKASAGIVYWRPLLTTGVDGRADVSFDLPNTGGPFRALIDAHADGHLGHAELFIKE